VSPKIRALSGDRIGIPLVEWTPCAWRTNNNLLEKREFLTYGRRCGGFGVGLRRDASQRSLVGFVRDCLARRPGNAIREVLRKAKRRDSIRRTCVDNFGYWDFERSEFRTRVRQQVKELDSPSGMPSTRIRCRYMDGGVQVERAKFASGVPSAAVLLRILCVCWSCPLRRDYAIVSATAANGAPHSHAAIVEQTAEIRIDRVDAIGAKRFQNGAVAKPCIRRTHDFRNARRDYTLPK
jgi:hypothetical protein